MVSIAIFAVVGGALGGMAWWRVWRRGSPLMYAAVGGSGSTIGLLLYALLRATLQRPVFWGQGIWWALVGVMFALMTVSVVADDAQDNRH